MSISIVGARLLYTLRLKDAYTLPDLKFFAARTPKSCVSSSSGL